MLRFRLLGLYVVSLVVVFGLAIGAVAGMRTPPGARPANATTTVTSLNHKGPSH